MNKFFIIPSLLILLLSSCKKEPIANFDYDNISQSYSKHNSKDIINLGDKIKFYLLTIDGEGYSWDFGDGGTSSELSPVHNYQKPGTYTVKLTVTNGSKQASITKSIKIGTSNYFAYSECSSCSYQELTTIITDTFTFGGLKYIHINAGTGDYFDLYIPLNYAAGNSYSVSSAAEIDYYWTLLSYSYSSGNSPSYYTLHIDENDAYHIKGSFTNVSIYTQTGGHSSQFSSVNFNIAIP